MSESLKELRERIQGPRRPYDTWYGRNVMRRFSIHLTMFFARMGAPVVSVTFLSVLAGLFGVFFLWIAWWGWGLFWVNIWYLLDHVDGELASLRHTSSATDLYFNEMTDLIVPPLALLALGIGLRHYAERELPFFLGLVASYASIMLVMVARGSAPSSGEGAPARAAGSGTALGALRAAVAFPVFLPVATAVFILASFALPTARALFLTTCLLLYALTATIVWIAVLAHSVWTKKPDRKLAGR